MPENNWVVYLVRCSDNSLYCGVTNDVHRRLQAHNSGRGARYTRSRRPVELICVSPEISKGAALRLEYRIKKVPADQKIIELNQARRELRARRDIRDMRLDINRIVKLIDKLVKEI
ncbi:COG2827: putative endonuclease containing a URI domain [Olavius algarvensis Delta 1 endosymbiont]|nr:COG2827: putative endonuclease containing a URI domain [Olavius algarvensis Delta 1 endosymbiont]